MLHIVLYSQEARFKRSDQEIQLARLSCVNLAVAIIFHSELQNTVDSGGAREIGPAWIVKCCQRSNRTGVVSDIPLTRRGAVSPSRITSAVG